MFGNDGKLLPIAAAGANSQRLRVYAMPAPRCTGCGFSGGVGVAVVSERWPVVDQHTRLTSCLLA